LKTREALGEATKLVQMRLKIVAGLVQCSGVELENYFLTVEGNKTLNFQDSQAMTKKIRYMEVKPRNGSEVYIFKQK